MSDFIRVYLFPLLFFLAGMNVGAIVYRLRDLPRDIDQALSFASQLHSEEKKTVKELILEKADRGSIAEQLLRENWHRIPDAPTK